MNKSNQVKVKLSQIRTDADMWARAAIDRSAVEDYADVYRDEQRRSQMPPVVLFKDNEIYWIGDGKHRCLGALSAELKEIWAEVQIGTERDANVYSAECNRTHGVRRSYKDSEKLIRCLLADEEWAGKSIKAIASKCGLSWSFVEKVRQAVNEEAGAAKSDEDMVTGADGKHYPAHRKSAEAGKIEDTKPAEIGEAAGDVKQTDQVPAREPDATPLQQPAKNPSDALGNMVPDEFAGIFAVSPQFTAIESDLEGIRLELTELMKLQAGSYLRLDSRDIEVGIKSMKAMLRDRKPHAVCPYCHGKKEVGVNVCKACKGRGWCTKPIFDQPRELAS